MFNVREAYVQDAFGSPARLWDLPSAISVRHQSIIPALIAAPTAESLTGNLMTGYFLELIFLCVITIATLLRPALCMMGIVSHCIASGLTDWAALLGGAGRGVPRV